MTDAHSTGQEATNPSSPGQTGVASPPFMSDSPGASAFAKEIFNLIGHDDVYDITLLQVDMYVVYGSCWK